MYVGDVSLTYVNCSNVGGGPGTSCTDNQPNVVPASTTTFSYDADGNRIGVTDPNNNSVSQIYDYLDRHAAEVKPRDATMSNTTNWNFDPAGQVTSIVRPGGLITAFSYDVNGRPLDTVQGADNVWAPSAGLVDANG